MNMNSEQTLNFIPSLNYRFKYIGLALFAISAILFLISYTAKLDFIGVEITKYMIACSLYFIVFSKENNSSESKLLLKYYSTKIIMSFGVAFILSLKLTELIVNKDFPLDNFNLVIILMAAYLIVLNSLSYLTKDKIIKVEEKTISELLPLNRNFYLILIFLSILTAILISYLM